MIVYKYKNNRNGSIDKIPIEITEIDALIQAGLIKKAKKYLCEKYARADSEIERLIKAISALDPLESNIKVVTENFLKESIEQGYSIEYVFQKYTGMPMLAFVV